MRHGGLLGSAVLLALLAPASAQAKPRAVPAVAVPGLTVEVRGVPGKATSVRVGGRRAKLVAGRKLRFVVPKVRAGSQRVAVRTSRGRVSVRLRIRPPFRGRFTARPETARLRRAEIGSAGGTVAAIGGDGSRFELTVPAGALDRAVKISLTPLRALRGLPSSGPATGVRMEPSGLKFARPATLTVTYRRAARHATVAFQGTSAGRSAKVIGAERRGRSVTFDIGHFSATALNQITDPSGWGGVLNALLTAPSMDLQDAETVADVLEIWEAEDPGSCARHAQLCGDVKNRAVAVVVIAFNETCQAVPRFNNLTELRRLEHLRERIKPGGWIATPQSCVNTLLNGLITAAATPTRENPLQRSATAHEQLDAAQLASADVNTPGPGHPVDVSHSEWMRTLRTVAANEGEPGLAAAALEHLQIGLRRALNDGLALCNTDQSAGYLVLRSAHLVANGVDAALAQELDAASDACFVGVSVNPAEMTMTPNTTQLFTATVSGAGDGDPGVIWTASGGVITGGGHFTAPSTPGDYTVTATSIANPDRSATAVVHVVPSAVELHGRLITLEVEVDIDGTGDNPFLQDTSFAPFDQSVTSSVSSGEASATGTASQKADTQNQGAVVTAHTESTLSAAADSLGSDAEARGEFVLQFVVTADGTPYTLTGTVTDPDGGAFGSTEVGFHQADPPAFCTTCADATQFAYAHSDSASSVSSSGTLNAGGYVLKLRGSLDTNPGQTSQGGWDVTLTIG